MKPPKQCALWEAPDLLLAPKEAKFECLETYVDESHLVRDLLKCRECGQLYFHGFYEDIDFDDGDDSQFSTYIPVADLAETEGLRRASSFDLLKCLPRLQKDFPKGAPAPTVRWMRK